MVLDGNPVHVLNIAGDLPAGVKLDCPLPRLDDLKKVNLEPAGPARWADQTVTTKGTLGKETGPFVIDTLTIPYRDANPFKTPMRIGGVGIVDADTVAVCTLMGDFWLVDGV